MDRPRDRLALWLALGLLAWDGMFAAWSTFAFDLVAGVANRVAILVAVLRLVGAVILLGFLFVAIRRRVGAAPWVVALIAVAIGALFSLGDDTRFIRWRFALASGTRAEAARILAGEPPPPGVEIQAGPPVRIAFPFAGRAVENGRFAFVYDPSSLPHEGPASSKPVTSSGTYFGTDAYHCVPAGEPSWYLCFLQTPRRP